MTVHAALELGRRLAARCATTARRCGRRATSARLFAPRLEDLPVEEFHVAVLDAQHRLERDVTVTRGILNSSLVHPREVFREAIAERAAAVILVHNHPSGDPTPIARRPGRDRAARRGRPAARHPGARSRDHRTRALHELRRGGAAVAPAGRVAWARRVHRRSCAAGCAERRLANADRLGATESGYVSEAAAASAPRLAVRGVIRYRGARVSETRRRRARPRRSGYPRAMERGAVVTATALREIIPGWSLGETANSRLDEELLVRAYRFSEEAHRGQIRNSGEPYVTHCVEVAKILADLQLDTVDRRQRADPRRRRGHERHASPTSSASSARRSPRSSTASPRSPTCRLRLDAGAAGRELPQAAALDREGRARHHHQARRPPAQHADARVPRRRRSGGASRRRRATSTRRSRTASAWRKMRWELEDLAFKHLETDEYKTLAKQVAQKRGEREALIATLREPLETRARQGAGSRTSRSPAGRSTSGRSTRR